jgi:hypothetical protein
VEQKDYGMEIVDVLARGKKHIRGISDVLDINHMMIVRKIASLEGENVVDFVVEGRNKVYSLKDSSEARAYILMMESYKLIRFLAKHPFLRDVVSKLQKDNEASFACFFGGYTKERKEKDSDVEIYLESGGSSAKWVYSKEGKWDYSRLDSEFSVGVIGDSLSKEIIENHVLIKGGDIFYERIFG